MRYRDWEQRLHRFCSQRRGVPFAWGGNDCALFVADAVRELTGVDLAVACRGRYADRDESRTLLESLGGTLESYVAAQTQAAGFPEVGVRLAQRGDMLLLRQDVGDTTHQSLAIVSLDGMRALLMHEERGLIRLPILNPPGGAAFTRAWSVR